MAKRRGRLPKDVDREKTFSSVVFPRIPPDSRPSDLSEDEENSLFKAIDLAGAYLRAKKSLPPALIRALHAFQRRNLKYLKELGTANAVRRYARKGAPLSGTSKNETAFDLAGKKLKMGLKNVERIYHKQLAFLSKKA